MKITQIDLYLNPIRLKKPFVISLGPFTHAENMLVRVTTDEGIIGFGECSPFPTIHGETMLTCFTIGEYLARHLLRHNPLEPATCMQFLDSIIFGNNCAKSAFEMALYDIAAQAAHLPLYRYLGGTAVKEIYTDYTISIGSKAQMANDALDIMNEGFRVIKVKLGGNASDDIERIKSIRAVTGPEIPMRIDANQGWQAEEAPEILRQLSPFNIMYCEEPVARWNFMALPAIRKASPIPLMADESCYDHHDAHRLIQINACDWFNIKLGKSGISQASAIAELATHESMQVQMGGFLESRLGFSAAAHFALAHNCITQFDFDTPLMFAEDPVEGGIQYGAEGHITVPETPGLGAKLTDRYLNSKVQKNIY